MLQTERVLGSLQCYFGLSHLLPDKGLLVQGMQIFPNTSQGSTLPTSKPRPVQAQASLVAVTDLAPGHHRGAHLSCTPVPSPSLGLPAATHPIGSPYSGHSIRVVWSVQRWRRHRRCLAAHCASPQPPRHFCCGDCFLPEDTVSSS